MCFCIVFWWWERVILVILCILILSSENGRDFSPVGILSLAFLLLSLDVVIRMNR